MNKKKSFVKEENSICLHAIKNGVNMTRDRSSEFLEKVDSLNNYINQSTSGISSDDPAQACNYVGVKQKRLDKELENILSQVTEVWEHVNTLKTRVDKLISWYREALKLSRTRTKKQSELDDQIFLVKTVSEVTRTKIRDMELDNVRAFKTTDYPVFIRIRKTQCSALKLTYIEIMNEYQMAETEYEDIVQACVEQQVEIAGSMYFEYDQEEMEGHGNWTFITPVFKEIIEREKRVLADTTCRNDEIAKLEKSLKELQELFLGMTIMVESQGELLDNRIERNMEAANATIKKGKGILHKAKKMKKKWFS